MVWPEKQLSSALCRWEEDKQEVQQLDVAFGNELKDSVTVVLDSLSEEFQDISTTTKEQLWQMYKGLLTKMEQTQKRIKELKLPPVKSDILKLTDAGPGVGCSNVEVRYRDAEMARILNSDRVNRVHRARDDSGQNEAERSNACIGEALVDGGALKWKYHEALDNLTKEEIEELSLDDIKEREEEAMKRNAWQVAKDVVERIQHEPGAAGDFMQSFLTPQRDLHFFFNTEQLRQFVSSSESKQKHIPGFAYFNKISMFLKQHMQVGELYLEYLKGECQQTSGVTCDFCTEFPPSVEALEPVPRPMPDNEALPKLCYLSYDRTPAAASDGTRRDVDDFQPRAQIKKHLEQQVLTLDDKESITAFSKTFAVQEDLVSNYLEHLHYLNFKKAKRTDARRKEKEARVHTTYEDYNWVEMFHARTVNKLTVPVLDLFLDRHSLTRKRMNKKQKIQVITAWLANSEVNHNQSDDTSQTNEEDDDGVDTDEELAYSDSDIEDGTSGSIYNDQHVVLCEVGNSSTEENSEGGASDQGLCVSTRVGRMATTYRTRHFFGD